MKGSRELVAILAVCLALGAASIDLILPAFPEMREAFGLSPDSTEVSWLVTSYFLGLGFGQLFYGPLSDRFGRKPLMYVGLVLYAVGAVAAALAPDLAGVVVARVVWGLGAAGPRSLGLAVVRDVYEGNHMARIMSQILAIFLLVPMFAPALGTVLLALGPWRIVFWAPVVGVVAAGIWMAFRLPETLSPSHRRSVRPSVMFEAARAVVSNRNTLLLGVAGSFLFGIMTGYVGSTQIIIEEVFGQGDLFPLLFGILGAALAAGSLISGRLVMNFGTQRVLSVGAGLLVLAAASLAALAALTDGHPPLWAFMLLLALVLPAIMALVPSLNSEAMAPLPHVAGMAAAIIGTAYTALGALAGAVIDVSYDGSVAPFAYGTLIYAVAAALCILASSTFSRWSKRGGSGARPLSSASSQPLPSP